MKMRLKSWLLLQSTLSAPDRGVGAEMLAMPPIAPVIDVSPVMVLDTVTDSTPVVLATPRVPVFAMVSDLIEIIETPEVLARLNPVFVEPVTPPTFAQRVKDWWARVVQDIKDAGDRLADLFRPKVPIEVYNEHRTSYI